MEHFVAATLTMAGRPSMLPGETLYETVDDVTLYDRDEKTAHVLGALYVTSHRIMWRNSSQGALIGLDLAKVSRVDTETVGMWHKNTKVVLHFLQPVESRLKIKCEKGGESRVLSTTQAQLASKSWLAEAKAAVAEKEQPVFSTRSAGIAGLIRRQDLAQRNKKQLAASAFSDLDTLMSKASKMVKLIERYTEEKRRDEKGKDGEDATEKRELDSLLQQIGIANPVTKTTAGRLYREELARELADFLAKPLEEAGGMLALTDIYCILNRARGTALVSPDDVLQACDMLSELGLPMRLRTFTSGVKVVQSDSHSDGHVAEQVKSLVAACGCLTAAEMATRAKVSFSVAKQQLDTAEQLGAVCRDESFQGLIFYPNRFLEHKDL